MWPAIASIVSVTCLAWFSEDMPFAIGYLDGKLLIGTKEHLEQGGIVLVDAHKVRPNLHAHLISLKNIEHYNKMGPKNSSKRTGHML